MSAARTEAIVEIFSNLKKYGDEFDEAIARMSHEERAQIVDELHRLASKATWMTVNSIDI